MLEFLKKKKRPQSTYKTFEIGFHGDKYLLELVEYLSQQGVSHFIETGSNVGTTFAYFAKNYPDVDCFTCEPDDKAFQILEKNTVGLNNTNLYHMTSQKFMEELKCRGDFKHITNTKVLFWLDAHSYGYEWPLQDEVSFIFDNFKNAYILIDDFKVPHNNTFTYDQYKDQLCAHEYIKDSIGSNIYELYYPDYSEKTSKHHPLVGWGLYVFGEEITWPIELTKKIRRGKTNA